MYPTMKFGDISKMIGQAWRDQTIEQKEGYNLKARIINERRGVIDPNKPYVSSLKIIAPSVPTTSTYSYVPGVQAHMDVNTIPSNSIPMRQVN